MNEITSIEGFIHKNIKKWIFKKIYYKNYIYDVCIAHNIMF